MAKKPKIPKQESPTLTARTAAGILTAAKTATTVVRVSRATLDKARQAPGAARDAIEKMKIEAKAAGHIANVAAEQATRVIATTAGVVAGIVESVSRHEPPAPASEPQPEPAPPPPPAKPARKRARARRKK